MKEVKRGEVASNFHREVDDDIEMASVTIISIIGENLREDADLVKDAKAFGHRVLFSR